MAKFYASKTGLKIYSCPTYRLKEHIFRRLGGRPKAALWLSKIAIFEQRMSLYLLILRCSIKFPAPDCLSFKRFARGRKAKFALSSLYGVCAPRGDRHCPGPVQTF